VFVISAGYGTVRLAAFWKRKRMQERSLLHHVEELTGAWQIRHDEVIPIELVGSGGYGEVHRCRYRDLFVAMKILRLPATDSMLMEFEREIKFMRTVRHPNIVLFLGAGRTADGSPFLVSEYVSRGSLRRILDDANTSITEEMQVKFCQDVARGMGFLHGLNPPRVHGDLKSDNLLISETNTIKIADFGLARQLSDDYASRIRTVNSAKDQRIGMHVHLIKLGNDTLDSPHALGASRWRAPELSVSGAKKNYKTPADVYSFAVVMWEIVTRELPFSQYEFNYEVVEAVKSGERPPLPDNCSPLLKSLILDCWKHDPVQRPSFEEIQWRLAAESLCTHAVGQD
jgi:serine/threonine protein kinase